jgi:hypothetical protein
VLSHEAIIDSAWDTSIKLVLLKRFPHATRDELRQAHGYAYGGAIIQGLGYYPHGSVFFSDLTLCLAKTSYPCKMSDLAQTSIRTFPIRL